VLVTGGVAIFPLARRQVTDALEISMVWFYAALPVGGALMILFALPQLWKLVRPR
jgi:TRAP-type C4-dicarboxylate transport system permease small subunit